MDSRFDNIFDPTNHIWQTLMDQLIELREWQRMQEEVVRERQSKQINSLTQQNTKLIALTNSSTTEDNIPLKSSSSPVMSEQCLQSDDKQRDDYVLDNSVEQIRAEDVFHQKSGNQSFGNESYLETSPVIPGIDGKRVKTFEELLNIRLNDKKCESIGSNENKPKKPFLRKGEGIKRFDRNKCLKDHQKEVCFKTNEIKNSDKLQTKLNTRLRSSVQEFINKRKPKKIEQNSEKPKKFIRKVIPMTAKFEKNSNKSVEISRNTPTVIRNDLNESESELFDYLQQIYSNISLEDNSFDQRLKNKDINELQDLLKKIETKRERIQKQFDGNCGHFRSDSSQTKTNGHKKRVHFSHISDDSNVSTDESDEHIDNQLVEPKAGPYSWKLKQQIEELEHQLSRLKNIKRDKHINDSVNKTKESSDPICEELIKLRQQIEKLNERIVGIESKAYDLSGRQNKVFNRKENPIKCFAERLEKTIHKTIRCPTVAPNVCVNDSSNETTIDFPNGDKMMVSKDNTIVYIFDIFRLYLMICLIVIHFCKRNDTNNIRRRTQNNQISQVLPLFAPNFNFN